MSNQFGDKIKILREESQLLQRQVASQLDMDTSMLSKIEGGDRKAKKEQITQFAKVLKVNADELLTLWLADQLIEVLEGEYLALKAIQVAEEEVKYNARKKK
ncbi:MAG TPA: helix-turn-helix transcriptional regulator [Puia sp.]|jgi:transcriptional regulator with XRE-family HTH domain|nr:helix-turn-helix transcriptional regulator [Puia sp.]